MAAGEQVAHDAVNPMSLRASSSANDDIATNTTVPSAGQAPIQIISNPGQQNDIEAGDQEQPAVANTTQNSESATQADGIGSEAIEPVQTESAASAALAEASGGSDTDGSRTETADALGAGIGHVRSNSVKKPTTFKSVSVTKNFLAKSAVAAPSARTGEKGMLRSATLLRQLPVENNAKSP